jgi:hypothetical protein
MSKKLLLTLGLVCLAMTVSTIPAQAQYGSLPIGTFSSGNQITCQSGAGWYFYTDSQGTKHYVNCYAAAVSNCPAYNNLGVLGTQPALGLTYGYLDPVGLVPGVTIEKGVIVLLSGQDGTSPGGDPVGIADGDFMFADYYFKQGYEIVQLAWDSGWEYIENPFPITTPPTYGSIQYAACNPATFLNYVFNQLYLPIYNETNNQTAGMCAHGFSAGSGAIAYSLAYYRPPAGTSWWMDNVELLAGPQFSDIDQGCATGTNLAPPVTVCGQNNNNQWGCKFGGTDTPWSDGPQYVGASIGWVQGWTNDQTCANSPQTSPTSNLKWLQQSIVDDGTNSPVFTYSHTAMAGWVCRTLQNQESQTQCSQQYNQTYCPNNSSAQGELFYQQVTANNAQPNNYAVYPIDLCNGAEGVAGGQLSLNGQTGNIAIEQDMAGAPGPPPIPAQCTHRTQ